MSGISGRPIGPLGGQFFLGGGLFQRDFPFGGPIRSFAWTPMGQLGWGYGMRKGITWKAPSQNCIGCSHRCQADTQNAQTWWQSTLLVRFPPHVRHWHMDHVQIREMPKKYVTQKAKDGFILEHPSGWCRLQMPKGGIAGVLKQNIFKHFFVVKLVFF